MLADGTIISRTEPENSGQQSPGNKPSKSQQQPQEETQGRESENQEAASVKILMLSLQDTFDNQRIGRELAGFKQEVV